MRAAFTVLLVGAALTCISAGPVQTAAPFDTHFTAETMRVDYSHTGGLGIEAVSLDRIVNDGPWPGNRVQLIDDTNLGKYLFEVVDRDTNQVIYSRGFASLFGEWETTAEAKERHRTFGESLRFPWPKRPVQLVLKKRDRLNAFHEMWSTIVDPAARTVNRARLVSDGTVWTLWESGPPEAKVDLLLLGDGLHRGRTAEVPRRREAAGREDVRDGALQEPSRRLQRAGDRPRRPPRAAFTTRGPATRGAAGSAPSTTSSTASGTR